MKIGIVGAGATGSVFAAYLKLGGIDEIWLIDIYKAHMDKVASSGLVFRDPSGDRLIEGLHATCNAADAGVCDAIIVLVKSTQTDSAMENAAPCIGPNTVVISLQNGLGNEIALKKYVPLENIMIGCGRIGTELPEPGVCVSKPNAGTTNMFIGPLVENELTLNVGKTLKAAFLAGGLEPEYHSDVRPYIWQKAISNSGFNTVCAVLRLKMREVAENEDGIELVKAIFKEASEVATASGIPPMYDKLVAGIPNTVANLGDYYPSMAQDMLIYQRETEVTALTGAIANYGKEVGVPTPTCDVLSQVVKAIQANYKKQYK